MSELIDTTEMYLRIFFELQEEGVQLLRARIAERLHQSGPTVSQTVSRMQRDGLVRVLRDRRVIFTPDGSAVAARVMRKHRLVERLLVDVIGLDWAEVHAEACRWEHVVSDDVERRILAMIEPPYLSPFGNPIPLLEELDHETVPYLKSVTIASLPPVSGRVKVVRFCEPLQEDPECLRELRANGVLPGAEIDLSFDDECVATANGQVLAVDVVEHIHVIPVGV